MTSAPLRSPLQLNASVVGLFVANGLLIGSYVGCLPALRERFAISSLGVSLILLTGGLCALTAMQLTGRFAERHGARRPVFLAPFAMLAGLLGLSFAPVYPVAVVAAGCFGAGNGMMDVAMNALGVEVEQRLDRVRMGLYHGSWSLGSFCAAMLVVAFGPLSAHVWPPVLTGIVLAGIAIGVVARWVPESRSTEPAEDGSRGALPPATWLLGVMALCFGFTEGTGFDWSSLHVAAVTHVGSGTAALGLACMSAAMLTIRFAGDAIVARTGRRPAVLVSAVVASCGYAVTFVATPLPAVLAGWVLVGFGVGLIAPQIYGLAGHLGGPRMLGVVVGFGYTSFLACPAIVGATAAALGLQHTMIIPLVAGLLLCAGAVFMPADPSDS